MMKLKRLAVGTIAIVTLACFMFAQSGPGDPNAVRAPAVAGQFYPAAAAPLKQAIEAYLADAVPARTARPIALVVPHAGYVYSAQIAADAYRQAAGHRYDLVVILGVNHSAAGFNRIAVYSGAGYRTPLGVAESDRSVAAAIVKEDPDCVLDQTVQANEHSVEVQVPFIQHLFPTAKIVAIVVGTENQAVCTRLGHALAKILKDRQPLIVASSDLSHYPSAAEAPAVDRRTLEAIAGMNAGAFKQATDAEMARGVRELATPACGAASIMAAMEAASDLGATRGVAISYANSSYVAVGDPDRVVGYGAVVLTTGERGRDTSALAKPVTTAPSAEPLDAADKQALLVLARETLRRYLTTQTLPLVRGFSPRAEREQGVFVTLKQRGQLRGCIGRIIGTEPLSRLVSLMALESALNDPRFNKVRATELDSIEIEISALTPPKAIPSAAAITVGRDGVILQKGNQSAVFLPQVATEQGWGRDQMLDNLCEKGGLSVGCWKSGAKLMTFQADVFAESEFKARKN